MPQKDYIGPIIRIKQSGTFRIDDIYKVLYTWFKDKGYDILEKEHKEFVDKNGIKHTTFSWEVDKRADEYVKYAVNVTFSAETQDVVHEEKNVVTQKGNFNFEFGTYLKKDIREEWLVRDRGAVGKFLREFYDKLFMKEKLESYEKKIQDDVKSIIYDLKTFLKLKRYD